MTRGHLGAFHDLHELFGRLQRGHERAVTIFRCNQLGIADMDGFIIEVAGALVLAAVRADGAGDERKRVFRSNDFKRFQRFVFARRLVKRST